MSIRLDVDKFASVIDGSADAEDCSENFVFFVEDYISFDWGAFPLSLKSLPNKLAIFTSSIMPKPALMEMVFDLSSLRYTTPNFSIELKRPFLTSDALMPQRR